LTIPHNKLIQFPGLEKTSYANTYVVGQPLTIFKGYQSTGVNPTTGLYQFKDTNEDGVIDEIDRQTAKFFGAHYYGGLQNSIRWKGFQFDFLFQFSKQDGREYFILVQSPGNISNQPEQALSRWTKPNDNSGIQQFSQSSAANTAYQQQTDSDKGFTDASYVRLKNVSLSYLFPQPWTSKVHLSSARVFLRGQNLLTMTKYHGLDPESQTSFLPPLRTLTGGLSLTF